MHKISDLRLLVNGASYQYASNGVCADAATFAESAPQLGGMIRIAAYQNAFSADAVCAAATIYAHRNHLHENTVVLVECDGISEYIPVVITPAREQATCVLPVPQISEVEADAAVVQFPGTACLVCQNIASRGFPSAANIDVVAELHPDTDEISIWRRNAHGAWSSVHADGLAAASAAITFAKAFADGVTEHDVQMPGGRVEVGVSMQKGRLTGLSVCSTVCILREEGDYTHVFPRCDDMGKQL